MSSGDNNSRFEDDGSSYMMSVSDIMSGLLFVFIITLMAFVLNFQQAQQEARAEQNALDQNQDNLRAIVQAYSGIEDLRAQMLRKIERMLERQNIEVVVDYDQGVLRLNERAIDFQTGSVSLDAKAKRNAADIAAVLTAVVPCYTDHGERAARAEGCDEQTLGMLEAVFIEGHTDNVPMLRNGVDRNWELSTNRAIRTYREFSLVSPELTGLTNREGQRVFSVAGYGDSRPLPGRAYESPTPDEQNRRIDLRFIMEPPDASDPAVIEALRARGAG